jgi:glutamyl-Q tRNA(Asp) synthetase
MDDLDTPRNVAGAAQNILHTLETFGLQWDQSVVYQSQQQAAYLDALTLLQAQDLLYPCTCSRKSLASDLTDAESVYPNVCRNKTHAPSPPYSLRIKTQSLDIAFQDGIQGTVTGNLATQHGDFILKRKDQIIAYQLAVVIDDHLQQVNHVVRGCDLLDSTIKQVYLHHCLQLTPPNYLHVPVLTGALGSKLSKRDFAPAVSIQNRRQILFMLLELLQQQPPAELETLDVSQQLAWAVAHWRPAALLQCSAIDVSSSPFATTI